MKAIAFTLGGFACAALLASPLAACGSDDNASTNDSGINNNQVGFGPLDGGTGVGDLDKCATDSKKAQRVPIDMVIGLDTSFSMDFESKWPHVRDALKSFVGNPAYSDLGIGLQFFPIRKQCSVAEYQNLVVPLALQPQAAAPFSAALDGQSMSGGTPMVPLLQGLTAYLNANKKPDRKPVIVLATDGFPDYNCQSESDDALPNTLENAVKVAGDAFKESPPLTTFVIGVGSELRALDQIASAGGTTKATLIDTGGDAQAALLSALENIRRESIPCDFDIPGGGNIDVNNANVTYTTNGSTAEFVFVENEAGCSQAPLNGWYFNDDKAPTKVVLCSATCDIVKGDDQGSVDVVFGCPRNSVR